ncbi:MAG: hypothetical protein U5P41_08525 [Gammaproteobacteria bacterium]|nr:hypothetical protein [Gammaproteobacteria bacterium]
MALAHHLDTHTRQALAEAWHQDSAASSLERWLDLCEQQGWGRMPENLALLTRVFGASWYFTRFIFFRGPAIADVFDSNDVSLLEADFINRHISSVDVEQETEQALESLRIAKNEIMLRILVAELQQSIDQAGVEESLTTLAEATLAVALRIYSNRFAQDMEDEIGVLGMGRMAGYEMNFGSDLDLIFLYPGESTAIFEPGLRLIRALLRGIAMAAPAGSLYDVDMRLRPHGAAGVLITSDTAFEEYHSAERDIWQRQLMTRCRPVVDGSGLAARALDRVSTHIYAEYDQDALRREVRAMRLRVENELGKPAGRYELKRGRGGVMDIDFISHFLQLAHGAAEPGLRTASTRRALQLLHQHDLLSQGHCKQLLEGYDFLKRMEGRLRVFDMKPISTISREATGLVSLARAMDYRGETDEEAARILLEDYLTIADGIRQIFDEILPGEIVNRES